MTGTTTSAQASLYVTGGEQREQRPLLADSNDWYEYRRGLILEVFPRTGEVRERVSYVSPPEHCAAERPQILFKSGSRRGDRLFVTTQTEVLVYALPDFTQVGVISLPCFNDVHHVHPTRAGTLLVANSGLDMALELSASGAVLREWSTLGEEPWARFSRAIDYRKGVSTKPHRSHPNYVFTVGDEPWATRFQQQDAISLADPARQIPIGIERVHDGSLYGGLLYFTTVNGRVVVVEPRSLRIEAVIDLSELHPPDTLLGWCRGILVQGDLAWVGFSTIRPTKFRENVAWVARRFRQVLPTRIACYDLARARFLGAVDLQAHGLNAVFSILPGG
jgi:hypothetical protein